MFPKRNRQHRTYTHWYLVRSPGRNICVWCGDRVSGGPMRQIQAWHRPGKRCKEKMAGFLCRRCGNGDEEMTA